VDAGQLKVSSTGGEINQITVEQLSSFFRISDDTADLSTADADCTQITDHIVRCSSTGVTSVTIQGRDLDDILVLEASTPGTLDGGSGNDDLTGGSGDDDLIAGRDGVGFQAEQLNGRDGGDTLRGPTNADASSNLIGGDGDDKFLGGPAIDRMNGDAGADDMSGGGGEDTINYFSATAGVAVTLDDVANDGSPGEGDNAHTDVEDVNGSFFADDITGSPANNVISGSGDNDLLHGAAGDDFLDGGAQDDTLDGGDGRDSMIGGSDPTGTDAFIGGPGIDSASFSDHSGPLTVTINNVANDGAAGEGDNVKTDVENVDGGEGADTITGSSLDNVLVGRNGNDHLNGLAGDDELYGEFQGFGGSSSSNTLDGGTGDDLLSGGTFGPDALIGGGGFDTASYTNYFGTPVVITINDVANDGAGGEGDNVRTTVENVLGTDANDTITGSGSANTLMGGNGADTLDGAGGNDLLDGEIPTFSFSFGPDVLIGGNGIDTVSYASHSNTVTADNDNVADDGFGGGSEGDDVRSTVENLFGGPNSDNLTGNNVANVLDGGPAGFDTLNAAGGSDFLSGGIGPDTLNGDAGNDRLRSRGDGVTDVDNCGIDNDSVDADAFDTINADCESVFNPAAMSLKTASAKEPPAERNWRAANRRLRASQLAIERLRAD
jgi:Ca2+-binding RTX toxin-like protein